MNLASALCVAFITTMDTSNELHTLLRGGCPCPTHLLPLHLYPKLSGHSVYCLHSRTTTAESLGSFLRQSRRWRCRHGTKTSNGGHNGDGSCRQAERRIGTSRLYRPGRRGGLKYTPRRVSPYPIVLSPLLFFVVRGISCWNATIISIKNPHSSK